MKPETINTIKQTIPVLEAQGEALTKRFYENMFANNPEVAPFFNPAHQKAGTQQRALANAICAYAQHVDEPSQLTDAVELIAHKHISLGIRPEHYPVVGENLLLTIQEMLGLDADDPVVQAWAEAYEQLAQVFIDREKTLYESQQEQHGWTGFKPFKVIQKQSESDEITSFYLTPLDDESLPPRQAGQYITVRLTLPDGRQAMRNYSLSDSANTPYYRISVKREGSPDNQAPAGAVSNHLHDNVDVDAVVEVAPPAGEFTLDLPEQSSRQIVMLAGGVGITPLLSMARSVLEAQPERSLRLIQAARAPSVAAFQTELATLTAEATDFTWHLRFSDVAPTGDQSHQSQGLIDAALIQQLVDLEQADFYLCGPPAMLQHTYQVLAELGVNKDRIHSEFFGPAQPLN